MTTQMPIASPRTEFYERAFGGFHDQAVAEVRKETYGEDLDRTTGPPWMRCGSSRSGWSCPRSRICSTCAAAPAGRPCFSRETAVAV